MTQHTQGHSNRAGLIISPSRLFCLKLGPWLFSFEGQKFASPATSAMSFLPKGEQVPVILTSYYCLKKESYRSIGKKIGVTIPKYFCTIYVPFLKFVLILTLFNHY